MVLWRPTSPSRTNMKKRCPFHHRALECKSRKSRDTWSNRQVWSTKWRRAEANRVFPRECTGHSKHLLPTTQVMTLHMDITRWSIQNQIDYIPCSWTWRSSIQSAKTRLGAHCASDHEFLTAKFRLKLKKVRITIRLFSSVQFSHSVVSNSSRPHESQHARPPCPPPTPRVHSNSCPSSQWCHPAISSSVVPSPPAHNPSQHQSLFQWVNSLHEVAKVLEFHLQHQSF